MVRRIRKSTNLASIEKKEVEPLDAPLHTSAGLLDSVGDLLEDSQYPEGTVRFLPQNSLVQNPNNSRVILKFIAEHFKDWLKLESDKPRVTIETGEVDTLVIPEFNKLQIDKNKYALPDPFVWEDVEEEYSELRSLAQSICANGYIQPIEATENPETPDHYEITYGNRRHIAGQMALQKRARVVISYEYKSTDQWIKQQRMIGENGNRRGLTLGEKIQEMNSITTGYVKRYEKEPTVSQLESLIGLPKQDISEIAQISNSIKSGHTTDRLSALIQRGKIKQGAVVRLLRKAETTQEINDLLDQIEEFGVTQVLFKETRKKVKKPVKSTGTRGRPLQAAKLTVNDIDVGKRIARALIQEFDELDTDAIDVESLNSINELFKKILKLDAKAK